MSSLRLIDFGLVTFYFGRRAAMLKRLFTECLVRPRDLEPSSENLEVIGTFNPGAVRIGDDVMLLVRVSETPKQKQPSYLALPQYDAEGNLSITQMSKDELILADPRLGVSKSTRLARLRFVSHLRTIRLKCGRAAESMEGPRFEPRGEYESFGVEDPRISSIDGRYYSTYVAVSEHGAATALASTADFKTWQRHGLVFVPENKDVVLFPEKIGGRYVALHRPNPSLWFSPPEMWISRSDDLMHWGEHRQFFGGHSDWSCGRIGAGTPPVRTDRGWLTIYHGNNKVPGSEEVGVYFGAALLLDLMHPERIIAHSNGPILAPEADFETAGFLNNIIFPTGLVEYDDMFLIYYGAADTNCGVVGVRRDELMATLKPV